MAQSMADTSSTTSERVKRLQSIHLGNAMIRRHFSVITCFPCRIALIQRPSAFGALSALGKRKKLHVFVLESWVAYWCEAPNHVYAERQ